MLGRRKEALAARFLRRQGLRLVQQNYSCRLGEIDLVMLEKQSQLVFVEVRFRSGCAFGGALASIGHAKQEKIRRTAAVFLQQHSQFANHNCRFDVVAIEGATDGKGIDWIKNAFY